MGNSKYDIILEQIDSYILNTLARSSMCAYELAASFDSYLERYHISLLSITNRLNELQLDCIIACICPEPDANRSFFALRIPKNDLPMFSLDDEMIDVLYDELDLWHATPPKDKIYLTTDETDGKKVLHIFEDALVIFEIDTDDEELISELNSAENITSTETKEEDDIVNNDAADESIETEDSTAAEEEDSIAAESAESETSVAENDAVATCKTNDNNEDSEPIEAEESEETAADEDYSDETPADEEFAETSVAEEYSNETPAVITDEAYAENGDSRSALSDDYDANTPSEEITIEGETELNLGASSDTISPHIEAEQADDAPFSAQDDNASFSVSVDEQSTETCDLQQTDEQPNDEDNDVAFEDSGEQADLEDNTMEESCDYIEDDDVFADNTTSAIEESEETHIEESATIECDDESEAIFDSEASNDNADEESAKQTRYNESEDVSATVGNDDVYDEESVAEIDDSEESTVDMEELSDSAENNDELEEEAVADEYIDEDSDIEEEIAFESDDTQLPYEQATQANTPPQEEQNANDLFVAYAQEESEIIDEDELLSEEEFDENTAQGISPISEENAIDAQEPESAQVAPQEDTFDDSQSVTVHPTPDAQDLQQDAQDLTLSAQETVQTIEQAQQEQETMPADTTPETATISPQTPPAAEPEVQPAPRRTAFSRADIQQELNDNPGISEQRLQSMRALGLIVDDTVPEEAPQQDDTPASATETEQQPTAGTEAVTQPKPEQPKQRRYSAVMTPRNELELYLQQEESEKHYSFKSKLHMLFSTPAVQPQPKPEDTITDKVYTSMSDFREEMRKKGYDVRQYVVQHTVQYYSQKYININSIKFATSCIIYFIALALIAIGYFVCDRYAGLGYVPYLCTAIALLVVPGFYGVNYLAYRDKHAPATFSLKLSLATSFMVALILMMVFLLIAFFNTSSGANISDINSLVAPVFYPAAMLMLLPISVLVYGLLYRTRKFYVQ